jgi:predicted ester cyclase
LSAEQNKLLMRRFFEEAWNQRDPEKIAEFFAPQRLMHRGPNVVSAPPSQYMDVIRRWVQAFPDLHNEIDLLIAEDDVVAVYFTFTGTHTGVFQLGDLTIQPTGRRIRQSEVYVFRYKAGQVVEYWSRWDRLGLLEDLGVADRAADVTPKR